MFVEIFNYSGDKKKETMVPCGYQNTEFIVRINQNYGITIDNTRYVQADVIKGENDALYSLSQQGTLKICSRFIKESDWTAIKNQNNN